MQSHHFTFDAMGSLCSLTLYAGSLQQAEQAADAVIAEVARIETRYSRYLAESTLTEINRIASSGGTYVADEETAALLDYAFTCHRISDGLFDITAGILRRAWDFQSQQLPTEVDIAALLPHIGMEKLAWHHPLLRFTEPGLELDFGGIGKEYAVDRAAAVCRQHDIHHGLIDFGGDLLALGPHPDGKPWQIGIRNPRATDEAITVIELARGAVATSGDYERFMDIDGERYCHLLDPQSGWPARGLRSVTIQAHECLLAGSIASIAMLKGEQGTVWLGQLGIAHLWVDDAGIPGGSLSPK